MILQFPGFQGTYCYGREPDPPPTPVTRTLDVRTVLIWYLIELGTCRIFVCACALPTPCLANIRRSDRIDLVHLCWRDTEGGG